MARGDLPGRPVVVAGAGTTSGRGWSRCCHRYRRRGGRRGIGGSASTGSGGGRGPARRGGTYPSGTGRGRPRTRCSAAGRSTEHGLWSSRSCRSRQMPLGTSSGRCPSTPRSARHQHAAEARKKGLRSGPAGPGRAGSRAGRPRPRTLAHRPDHETAPARERLVPRPGDRGHRRAARRCPGVHRGHGTHPHTPAGPRTPTRPPRPCASGPRVIPPRPIREYLRRRQIAHTIPEKRDQAGHRLQHGSARGRHTRLRPRTLQMQAQGRMPDRPAETGSWRRDTLRQTRRPLRGHRPTHPDTADPVTTSQTRPSCRPRAGAVPRGGAGAAGRPPRGRGRR